MSTDAITVHVTKYGDRKRFLMYFDDPITLKRHTKSTGKTAYKEALGVAKEWQSELRAGRGRNNVRTDWGSFRERYENEEAAGLALKTANMVGTVFNHVEKHLSGVKKVGPSFITSDRISYFASVLRGEGKAENTIKSYLGHLRAILNWAKRMGIIAIAPEFSMPQRAKNNKRMKGRPITLEEFERMLEKTPLIVGDDGAESWQHLLTGLWLSGLRLGEALELYWDREDKLGLDFSGRRPMFRILAHLEKGNQDRLLPMTPDFAAFLDQVPAEKRTGPVFVPAGRKFVDVVRSTGTVSRAISEIGKAAGVKVNVKTVNKQGKTVERVKYASAHDLRRSFGTRWSVRVMSSVLQKLMRHAAIETTLKYYVDQDAQVVAEAVWAFGEASSMPINTSVNSGQKSAEIEADSQPTKKSQTLSDSRLA